MSDLRVEVKTCEHGAPFVEFCSDCAHRPAEEWVGYPLTICVYCIKPWPCDYERERRARGESSKTQTASNE